MLSSFFTIASAYLQMYVRRECHNWCRLGEISDHFYALAAPTLTPTVGRAKKPCLGLVAPTDSQPQV